jgi:hypothetical protein
MGSYAFPTQYGDGTAVYPDDFSANQWPDSGSSLIPEMRWIYGELEYYKMVSPSSSCMRANLSPNNKVRAKTLATFSKLINRPVVCQGTKLIIIKIP